MNKCLSKASKVVSSVSTVFKVHYNQKLGEPIRPSWGMHHGLWRDRRPCWPLGAICTISPISLVQILRHSTTTSSIGEAVKTFGTEFCFILSESVWCCLDKRFSTALHGRLNAAVVSSLTDLCFVGACWVIVVELLTVTLYRVLAVEVEISSWRQMFW